MNNSGSLFSSSGLEQDTGRISDRWQQDGSILKNIYYDVNDPGTVFTVTAGKTFYLNGITLGAPGAGAGAYILRDGGAGGDEKVRINSGTYGFIINPPIAFETDIYADEDGVFQAGMTLSGWEE